MLRATAALFTLLLFTGCVTTEYMGREYAPTENVDVYFSMDDIDGDFEVMGELTGEAGEYDNFEHMEDEMIEEAKKKGADAIVFEDMDTVTVGTTTTYFEDDTKRRHRRHRRHKTAVTTDIKDKIIKAELVKYN